MAQVGSQLGDWFNQVALAQITLALTHSPSAMGLVLLCRSLPVVLLGPLASPLVDRFPKKTLLFGTDVVRAVFALTYSLAIVFHANWILYLNSLLLGISGVLFTPARSATIPLVVSEEELTRANAIESGAGGILQMIGAACGGIVAATVSPMTCFVINSASYIWSAVHILRAKWQDSNELKRTSTPYFHALKEGFHEALRNRVARAIILIGISWGLAGGAYYILVPVLGGQTFHMGGLGIGVLYTVDGLGVLIGSYFVHRFVSGNHRRAVVWYGVAYLTQALCFALMTQSKGFPLVCVMLFLMRVSGGVIIPLDTYLLQTSTDPKIRGRVFSLHSSTYGGVMQLSYVLNGWAFETLSIPTVGIIVGAMSLLCGVSWLVQFGRPTSPTSTTADHASS
jgi:MFS family permease